MWEKSSFFYVLLKNKSLSVCRCAGMQVCRCAGMQVCRYVGMSVCRYVGMSVCRCAGVQVCRTCLGVNFTKGFTKKRSLFYCPKKAHFGGSTLAFLPKNVTLWAVSTPIIEKKRFCSLRMIMMYWPFFAGQMDSQMSESFWNVAFFTGQMDIQN